MGGGGGGVLRGWVERVRWVKRIGRDGSLRGRVQKRGERGDK